MDKHNFVCIFAACTLPVICVYISLLLFQQLSGGCKKYLNICLLAALPSPGALIMGQTGITSLQIAHNPARNSQQQHFPLTQKLAWYAGNRELLQGPHAHPCNVDTREVPQRRICPQFHPAHHHVVTSWLWPSPSYDLQVPAGAVQPS